MAAFESETTSWTSKDTSSTAPFNIKIYKLWESGTGYHDTVINNGSSGTTIYVRNISGASTPIGWDPPEGYQTKDEKRSEIRWLNKIDFWRFIDWLFWPRCSLKDKLPDKKLKLGTADGLRPTPMLC